MIEQYKYEKGKEIITLEDFNCGAMWVENYYNGKYMSCCVMDIPHEKQCQIWLDKLNTQDEHGRSYKIFQRIRVERIPIFSKEIDNILSEYVDITDDQTIDEILKELKEKLDIKFKNNQQLCKNCKHCYYDHGGQWCSIDKEDIEWNDECKNGKFELGEGKKCPVCLDSNQRCNFHRFCWSCGKYLWD